MSEALYQTELKDLIVVPGGLEPPPRGPKPRVLPLDERTIYRSQYWTRTSDLLGISEAL
jgi:hypothetical protein